jgi:hypothetical protein
MTAVPGHRPAPRGTNQRPLTLSLFVGVIAIASLIYCLLPRLGMDAGNGSDPIAAIATQPAAELSPALGTYRDALECLDKGEDAAARGLIFQGQDQALDLTRLSSVDTPAGEIAGAAMLLRLSGKLCDRAARAAAAGDAGGDRSGALGWLRAARRLGDHVLATRVPTLDALLAARAMDRQVGRAEVSVLRRLGRTGAAARATRRAAALDRFWATRVTPHIRRATADHSAAFQREMQTAAAGRSSGDVRSLWQAVDRRDAARAENLIALYGQERKRVGDGE